MTEETIVIEEKEEDFPYEDKKEKKKTWKEVLRAIFVVPDKKVEKKTKEIA